MKTILEAVKEVKDKIYPVFNGKECMSGCNCLEIAEAKNGDMPVKDFPCLGLRRVNK